MRYIFSKFMFLWYYNEYLKLVKLDSMAWWRIKIRQSITVFLSSLLNQFSIMIIKNDHLIDFKGWYAVNQYIYVPRLTDNRDKKAPISGHVNLLTVSKLQQNCRLWNIQIKSCYLLWKHAMENSGNFRRWLTKVRYI